MSTFASIPRIPTTSVLLPPEARMALIRAAQEAQRMTDELAREIHISNAVRRVKLQYPEYFHQE